MSCGARVRPRWRSSTAITRIPGRTCRCRILRNLLVSLQLIAIPTEEMIGENDTHYLFIRLGDADGKLDAWASGLESACFRWRIGAGPLTCISRRA